MIGFRAFLAKEFSEILRTWRIWVLPGIVLFSAVTGPVLALFMPQLLAALAPEMGGVVIQIPDPTFRDAYRQWTGSLVETVTIAIIVIFAGAVSAERGSGTAVLVLTKPLSRTAFIVAKCLSQGALLIGTVAVGTVITWALTYAVFGEAPLGPLAGATGIWLVWALMLLGIMVFLSALVGSQAGAAGLGLGAFVLVSIATLWAPAVRYGPAGLLNASSEIILGRVGPLLWPIVTGLALGALALAGAVWVFSRKEL
jgi:ABC-2 type transport system permease protein